MEVEVSKWLWLENGHMLETRLCSEDSLSLFKHEKEHN